VIRWYFADFTDHLFARERCKLDDLADFSFFLIVRIHRNTHIFGSMKVTGQIVKVLGICGSLKKASVNMEALKYMASVADKVGGIEMEIADISEVPFFNADKEHDKPASVQRLLQQMKDADAFVLASPEYNYSFTPALKNALDWGSRIPGNEGFKDKAASMLSVGGGLKGARSQYHIRQVCVFLDLLVLNKPEVMLSAFDGTFDSNGKLVSEAAQNRMFEQLEALKKLSLMLSSATQK
jgi:chromate reductase